MDSVYLPYSVKCSLFTEKNCLQQYTNRWLQHLLGNQEIATFWNQFMEPETSTKLWRFHFGNRRSSFFYNLVFQDQRVTLRYTT